MAERKIEIEVGVSFPTVDKWMANHTLAGYPDDFEEILSVMVLGGSLRGSRAVMGRKLIRLHRAIDALTAKGIRTSVGGWVFEDGEDRAVRMEPETWAEAARAFELLHLEFPGHELVADLEPTWKDPDRYIRHTDPRAFDLIAAMAPFLDWAAGTPAKLAALPGRDRFLTCTALGQRRDYRALVEYTYQVSKTGDWGKFYDPVAARYAGSGLRWTPGFFLESLRNWEFPAEPGETFLDAMRKRGIFHAWFHPRDNVDLFPTLEWWKAKT